jgi:hypothetical protein
MVGRCGFTLFLVVVLTLFCFVGCSCECVQDSKEADDGDEASAKLADSSHGNAAAALNMLRGFIGTSAPTEGFKLNLFNDDATASR